MIKNPTKEQLKTLKMIIYLFTNKVNGKQYVGQTGSSFKSRYGKTWYKHSKNNQYIKRALLKYGQNNFYVSILEYNIDNFKELDKLETSYIKKLNTIYPNGYNLTSGGCKHHKFCNAAKLKMSNGNSKEYIVKDNNTNKIITIKNLSHFCRKNNLSKSGMKNMIVGKTDNYKQYTLPNNSPQFWEIISPNNKIYKIFKGDLGNFCREENLPLDEIWNLICKRRYDYSGWKIKDSNITKKFIKVISPDNKEFIVGVSGIKQFCLENKISINYFYKCIHKGIKKFYKNWVIKEIFYE